jgi:hypothetical protein
MSEPRTCRVCGCTEDDPCLAVEPADPHAAWERCSAIGADPADVLTCAWVEWDLCSACQGPHQGETPPPLLYDQFGGRLVD